MERPLVWQHHQWFIPLAEIQPYFRWSTCFFRDTGGPFQSLTRCPGSSCRNWRAKAWVCLAWRCSCGAWCSWTVCPEIWGSIISVQIACRIIKTRVPPCSCRHGRHVSATFFQAFSDDLESLGASEQLILERVLVKTFIRIYLNLNSI